MTQCFLPDQISQAAVAVSTLLSDAQRPVAFTGAGISTESGIPDFRSPGGVWSRSRIIEFDEFLTSAAARQEYWTQKAAQCAEFGNAKPNVTHSVLAEWESSGRLQGVITQNIDGLHQLAGSRHVLELHGTARRVACLDCDWAGDADEWNQQFLATSVVPDCPACGGRIKHATISFGQTLPRTVLETAASWAQDSDLFFALGSSLVVEPAASLPRLAASRGASLVIVNRDPTPLDGYASLIVRAPLGALFSRFIDA